jgi:predicted nucleic acid-binding Zn ribbon protein
MPLYEYRCRCCGARFERLVRSAATAGASGAGGHLPAIVCPECASEQVERLLSVFARAAPACAPAHGGG